MKNYLDARQQDLINLGYTLEEVPMPLPQLVEVYEDEEKTYKYPNFIVRSYSNSLIINTRAASQVLIPEYTTLKWYDESDEESEVDVSQSPAQQAPVKNKYIDDDLIPEYRKAVEATYKKYFDRTTFILADDLIADAGAIHCTTMQIPE